jgi:hypothetical protein
MPPDRLLGGLGMGFVGSFSAALRMAGAGASVSARLLGSWGERGKAEDLTTEVLRDEIPAERRVVRGAVNVAMTALDRLRVQDGTRAAPFEQAVNGPDTEPRDERLVATVPGAVQVGKGLAPRRPVEDLADVVPVQRAGRVDFGSSLGEPELQRHGLGGRLGPEARWTRDVNSSMAPCAMPTRGAARSHPARHLRGAR